MKQPDKISELIKTKARSLGFSECAIIPSGFLEEEKCHLLHWLEEGMNGQMHYMIKNTDMRLDPSLLFKNAKSLIIVIQNYFTTKVQRDDNAPVISKYAYGIDYHILIKKKLQELLKYIQKDISPCKGRPFTDSAPTLERAWAKKAGLGWIGKNSNLISPGHGSFLFIGELIVDVELPYDKTMPVKDRCGSCTRCIDACPANAIVADRIIDARKCISYQTIERREGPERMFRGKLANRLFGCDICQDVCPWNQKIIAHDEPEFSPDERVLSLTRKDWYDLEESLFDELFRNSPLQRKGFNGIKKNLEFIE